MIVNKFGDLMILITILFLVTSIYIIFHKNRLCYFVLANFLISTIILILGVLKFSKIVESNGEYIDEIYSAIFILIYFIYLPWRDKKYSQSIFLLIYLSLVCFLFVKSYPFIIFISESEIDKYIFIIYNFGVIFTITLFIFLFYLKKNMSRYFPIFFIYILFFLKISSFLQKFSFLTAIYSIILVTFYVATLLIYLKIKKLEVFTKVIISLIIIRYSIYMNPMNLGVKCVVLKDSVDFTDIFLKNRIDNSGDISKLNYCKEIDSIKDKSDGYKKGTVRWSNRYFLLEDIKDIGDY